MIQENYFDNLTDSQFEEWRILHKKLVEKDTNYVMGYSLKTLNRQYGIYNLTEEEKEWGNLVDNHKKWGNGKRVKTFRIVNGERVETPTPNYTKLMEQQVPKDFQKWWVEYKNKRQEYTTSYNWRYDLYDDLTIEELKTEMENE